MEQYTHTDKIQLMIIPQQTELQINIFFIEKKGKKGESP